MIRAFVIGNGISRQDIDLAGLRSIGKIYGCNALYRDIVPDVLVATDRPIAEHIQNSGYAKNHKFYTRRPLPDLGAHRVPDPYFGYSSGPIAMALAAQDGARRVYLLGFDMGPTPENTINNLYAGTEFYRRVDAPPTFVGNWIRQICHIAKDHPHTRFVRVSGSTTAKIAEFEDKSNIEHLEVATFVDRINNAKDL